MITQDRPTIQTPLGELVPSRWQPRQSLDAESLLQLALSIQEQGVLTPILVWHNEDGETELIAGERRTRASVAVALATHSAAWIAEHGNELEKAVRHLAEHGWMRLAAEFKRDLAGITLPAVILDGLDHRQLHQLVVVENIQHEHLTPVEEGRALKDLQEENDYSQRQLARVVGRSQGWVQQRLALVDAAPGVQQRVNTRVFTVTHARALAPLPAAVQEQVADQVEKLMEATGDTAATTRKVQAFASQAKEFLNPNRWEPNGSEPLAPETRNLRALLAHLLRSIDEPALAEIVVALKEAGDLGRKPQSADETTLTRILAHFTTGLSRWARPGDIWDRLANDEFSCTSCLWQATHERMPAVQSDLLTGCRRLDGKSAHTCLYYVRQGDARWPALLPVHYRIGNNLPDDQPGLRRLDENGRGPWFARPDAFPILYQAAVDRQRERDRRQEQQRNTGYLKTMRQFQGQQTAPATYLDLDHPQAHACRRCIWHRPGGGSDGVECHYAAEPRQSRSGRNSGAPEAPDYGLLVRRDGLVVPRCGEFVAQDPLALLGAEPGRIALPRDATLDWFRHLLKRNNNYHTTTLPRFLSWLTHPGDGAERRLQRIQDLWNEASDAQIARLFSVLISEAGAANNYRTPVHLLNPLTGEIEDWATIDQPTVEDTRVPYNYPKDWPRPWTANDGGNEHE
jgi:ParB-like chromosome segregation protein Spo0J